MAETSYFGCSNFGLLGAYCCLQKNRPWIQGEEGSKRERKQKKLDLAQRVDSYLILVGSVVDWRLYLLYEGSCEPKSVAGNEWVGGKTGKWTMDSRLQ